MCKKSLDMEIPTITTARRTARADTARYWSRRRAQNHGFTLIELMVVVVVVALLAAIAFHSYQLQVRKSRRTTARTAVLAVASREEQYYSLNNAYTNNPALLGYGGFVTFPVPIPDATTTYYTLNVALINGGTTSPFFQVTATPAGDQSSDSCGALSVDGLGTQSPTTSGCS